MLLAGVSYKGAGRMSEYLTDESIAAMTTHGIPDYMQGGLIRYFNNRLQPGHFLTAVLSNDLMEAFARADEVNTACMESYLMWLYNDVPGRAFGAWGSPKAVKEWLKGDPDGNDVL